MLIALTGPNGIIGTKLIEMIGKKHTLRILSRTKKKSEANVFKGDLNDAESLKGFCDGADAVVHMAAVSDTAFDKCFPTNVLGTYNLAAEAARAGVRKFIFFSSGAAYGASSQPPFKEWYGLHPDTAYGLSKALAEQVVRHHSMLGKMQPTILRISSIYGPHSTRGVIHNYVTALLAGKPLRLDGDGQQVRDYVYVDDLADACMRVLAYNGAETTFNLGGGTPVSLMDLITAIERVSGKKAKLDKQPFPAGVARKIWLDISLARKELNWKPQTGLDKGLAQTLAYFKGNG